MAVSLLVGMPAAALDCGCAENAGAKLQCLLSDSAFRPWAQTQFGGVSLDKPAVIVAWDHTHDQWTIYEWSGKVLTPRRGKAQLSNGTLQVDAGTGQNVLLFATNTNPLVYSADATALTTTDTEEVATLKTFATLLGTLIKAWAAPEGLIRSGVETPVASCPTAALGAAGAAVGALAGKLGDAQTKTLSYMQVAEFGVAPTGDLKETLAVSNGAIVAADKTMGALISARADLARCLPCRQIVDAAKTADAEQDPRAREKKLKDLQQTVAVCNPADRALWESAVANGTFQPLKDYEGGYNVLDAADQMIAKRQALFKTAAWLTAIDATASHYSAQTYDSCYFTDGVVAVRGGAVETVFDKKNSGGFHLTASVPMSDFQTRRAADVTKNVEVTSTTRWGLGASIIFTPLKEKSWSSVPDPNDANKSVIGKPSESSRSGQIALLANFHPGWRWTTIGRGTRLGLQFGAATDTNKPAFFLGLSADMGRWFRIGAGGTLQRVKLLTAGAQELVTPVASGAAVPTRDGFKQNYYIALSLSLDGIPLFNAQ